jgi:hypothetical protein
MDQKKARLSILISLIADFNLKLVRREKEDYFISIKGTIHQEDVTIVNIYALFIGTKIIYEILANQVQEHIKKTRHLDQVDFISEMKDDSIYENQ